MLLSIVKTIRPYHFAEARPAGFVPYYQALVAANGVMCFDFEDSIRADNDEALTTERKHNQRQLVRQLLATPGLDFDQLALRLNAPDTPHYPADLLALRGLPGLHAVFVAKIEHPEQLRQVLRDLPLPVRHLIAVVETETGFANLPELLALADPRLGLVAFGHCDYNLSRGHFPFFHQDSPTYWEWVHELDRHLQAAGKQLLNSPVLQLADLDFFRTVLRCLHTYPTAAGQITLCLSQTVACQHLPAAPLPALPVAPRVECAQHLASRFEQAQQTDRFFAVDAERRLISPHEYEAARRQCS